MKRFEATLAWQRGDQAFTDLRYSRAHRWQFDGGLDVPASSSPLSVPVPLSDPAAVDPEEALVAAAASCHMLFFLSLAAARGYVVDRYDDRATGTLDTGADGRAAITRIVLRPAIAFGGTHQPDHAALAELHREAHARCYIANSLKGEIVVEGFE
ncbi:OsmC family protein [Massilia sp. TW-1]|uniref:OsmC family protein n=1 Tax=Telluria antibiotica TaxID=2717319 RepID=A0ABX0PD48_9BURK|nr:OsmC family protein [Telluria antibiotica]NIA54554.1 OsmC family protein [Telluria antibiotica]